MVSSLGKKKGKQLYGVTSLSLFSLKNLLWVFANTRKIERGVLIYQGLIKWVEENTDI